MRHVLGALQTLGTVAVFVLGGIAAAALYPSPMPARDVPQPTRVDPPPGDPTREERTGERWLVDGYNVIQVALLANRTRDGWWSEARRGELLERADGFQAESPHAEVQVVFDGPEPAPSQVVGVGARAVFAPSADAWILAQLADSATPSIVVTADRRLASRARQRGARIVAPARFLARCCGDVLE